MNIKTLPEAYKYREWLVNFIASDKTTEERRKVAQEDLLNWNKKISQAEEEERTSQYVR